MPQANMYDVDDAILSLAKSLMGSEDYMKSPLFPLFSEFLASYIPATDTQQGNASILKQEMKHILDHIPLGIVIVDAEGQIQPAYSQFMIQLYPHEKDLAFKPIENILFGKSHTDKDKSTFKNWLKLVFDKNYDWDLIKDLGPEVIRHESNGETVYYQNLFHRITHENGTIYLIIHITDISEKTRREIALEEKAAAQQFEVELLSCIVDHEYNLDIMDFINDTERLIRDARMVFRELEQSGNKPSEFDHLFRLIHSIKGLSGAYGIKEFVRLTNKAEDILSLFRDHDVSFESGQVDGEPASEKLRDTMETLSALFDRAKGIVLKIFNPEQEDFASIRVKRRGLKINNDRLSHVIQQVKKLKEQPEHPPENLSLTVDHVLSEIMSLALHPIDVVYNRLKTIARDVSLSLGKQVDLILEGDRVFLDPDSHHLVITSLIHILRNALDHGIETPEERAEAGKNACGTIHISTKQSQGNVTIKIRDDGRGIDPECVAAKAVEKGIITKAQASAMSSREKIDLIFLPGFTLKTEVTDLSGRGVGMDTVRDGMEKLNGTMTLDSRKGEGTALSLTFPLPETPRGHLE